MQKVKLNHSFSTAKSISAGVPQGSLIASTLLNHFINDIFQFNINNIEFYLYADDIDIILSADTDIELQSLVGAFFLKYTLCCLVNCVVINPTKSNFLLFNSSNITVNINGHFLHNLKVGKYLGLYIDNKLLENCQIKQITQLVCQGIGMLIKILPYAC